MVKTRVIVKPNASHAEVIAPSTPQDMMTVKVKAPAKDNKANEAVCKELARWANVAPSSVSVVNGHTARIKTIEFKTLDALEVFGTEEGKP